MDQKHPLELDPSVVDRDFSQPEEAPQPKATALEEVDRLRGEVAHTKLQLAQVALERAELAALLAQQEVQRAQRDLEKAQAAMTALHAEISEKYGIDWATHRIRGTDGKIITVEEAQSKQPS